MRRSLRQEAQTPTVLLRSEVCFLHFIWGLHTTPFSALWVRFGFGVAYVDRDAKIFSFFSSLFV